MSANCCSYLPESILPARSSGEERVSSFSVSPLPALSWSSSFTAGQRPCSCRTVDNPTHNLCVRVCTVSGSLEAQPLHSSAVTGCLDFRIPLSARRSSARGRGQGWKWWRVGGAWVTVGPARGSRVTVWKDGWKSNILSELRCPL